MWENIIKICSEKDADLSLIRSKKVAVIGYGSQGFGHSNNLKDSGVDVVVGLRDGSSSKSKAESAGLKVMSIVEATKWADVIMILIPDETQGELYNKDILPNLSAEKYIAFAHHGFNVRDKQIKAPEGVSVIIISPEGASHLLRENYLEGIDVPCFIAVESDANGVTSGDAKQVTLSYAIGWKR